MESDRFELACLCASVCVDNVDTVLMVWDMINTFYLRACVFHILGYF